MQHFIVVLVPFLSHYMFRLQPVIIRCISLHVAVTLHSVLTFKLQISIYRVPIDDRAIGIRHQATTDKDIAN
jgi:hypothetical protein